MDSIGQADKDALDNLPIASQALIIALWRERPAIMRHRTGKALPNVRPL